jgi:glycosyltransferase involved in cell wall biosynthesis
LKRYGIQTLVKAIPLLRQGIPEVKIHVVGDGIYRQYLEQLAHNMGVDKYLNFTGYVPYKDVPPYIAQADICVAPAIDDVGAPNKIFEYSALSKPTVASALPGIRSVFDDSCVLYYRPGSEDELAAQILELYHNAERREFLAVSAHEVYRKFRWPVMKQAYLGVYKQLLG